MRKSILNNLIPREDAVNKLIKSWNFQSKTETIKLEEAFGRVTAADIVSNNSLPVYRASMVDGIAVRKSDFKDGIPDTTNWEKNMDYAQADTGDDFNDEFDSVIMIEKISFDEKGRPIFAPTVNVNKSNIRSGGTTIKKGELILNKNTKIKEIQLSALAAGGIKELLVYKKPKVVFIPTGNELIHRRTIPTRGKNVESNSIMVKAMLEKMGAEFVCYHIIPDDIAELSKAIEKALKEGDIILICAGSAKGEEDYTHVVLNKYSKVIQHGIATAPGRPTGFALADNKPIINIPGPTLGAYYAIDLCVTPLIDTLMHQSPEKRETQIITLGENIKTVDTMEFIIRMRVVEKEGSFIGYPVSSSASFPTTARECNALLFVPIGIKGYNKGQEVVVELLYGRKEILQYEVNNDNRYKVRTKRLSLKRINR
ncbi:MAG: molybdopterin molybdotransferase MoeA [Anaerovoracaceae bacterium]|jgi:molybdopterin molybdotransferase